MATVTSFEGLDHPAKSELRQFAELFAPLFQASTEEAKRQAVAALSQCPTVPQAVATFVACQPISIAAPFITSSPCLDDDMLIMIARTQGAAHAKAIVRREALSPAVIDALVGLRHTGPSAENRQARPQPDRRQGATPQKKAAAENPMVTRSQMDAPTAASRQEARDDELRDRLKNLARHMNRPAADRLGLRTLTPVQEALLVRFSRTREPHNFATTLSDALSASRWLSERIMLDVSGRQLGVTLTGLGMDHEDAIVVLSHLYPHLARKAGGTLRAEALLTELDPAECHDRVEAWRRADSYTFPSVREDVATEAPAPMIRQASNR